LNSLVAKTFNQKTFNTKENVEILQRFADFMEEGKDFKKESDDKDEKLWKELRKLDETKKMPKDAFQDWD
jgi:hypothetical protein